MRRTLSAIAVILFLVAARKPHKPEPSGTMSGRVISDYAPVPTATVHVWLNKKEVAKSATDAKGEFHFKLRPETYEVDAEASRLRPKIAQHIIVVVHPDHETWVNIELIP